VIAVSLLDVVDNMMQIKITTKQCLRCLVLKIFKSGLVFAVILGYSKLTPPT